MSKVNVLPEGWSKAVPLPPKYRNEEEISALIKTTLLETGLVQRVEVKFINYLKIGYNVTAYSNKYSGGWKVDMHLHAYQFDVEDTVEQMQRFIRQEFMVIVRNTIDKWFDIGHPNFQKVMKVIFEDVTEHDRAVRAAYRARVESGEIVDDGIN